MIEQPDCLHLHIINASCSCGNKWKHSNLWLASREAGYLGGTPDAMQVAKFQVLSMEETQRNYDHCFRCVPLALGKNWVSPAKLQMIKEGEALRALAAKTEDLLA